MKKITFVSVTLIACMWTSALRAEETAPAAGGPEGQAPDKAPVAAAGKPPVSGIIYGDPSITTPDGTVTVGKGTVFSVKAVGGVSGVAKSEYRLDGRAWKTYEPFTIAEEGAHLIEYRSIDNAGNEERARSLPVRVDVAPPATILFIDGKKVAPGRPVLITAKSTLTLVATDDYAGVAAVEYRIDGGPWRDYAPFTVSGKGGHTIGFRSRDNVGNLEDEKIVTAGSDRLPPKTVISVGGLEYAEPKGPLYANGSEPFTLTVASVSGVSKTEYKIDEGEWTAYAPFTIGTEGTHRISYRSIDRGANVENPHTVSVTVDSTPPQTTLYCADQEREAGGTIAADKELNFTLAASDKLSPVKTTEYRINDGPWTPYAPFGFVDEGEYRIQYRSTDSAGNAESPHTFTAIIDKTPPVSEIAIDRPTREVDGATYITSTTTLVPKASDNLSGVDNVEYWIDGKKDERNTTPFGIQTQGRYRIEYQAVDKAGNVEPVKTLVVVVDDAQSAASPPEGNPFDEVGGMKKHVYRFDEKSPLAASASGVVTKAVAGAASAPSPVDGAVPSAHVPDGFAAGLQVPAAGRGETGGYGEAGASPWFARSVGAVGDKKPSMLEYVTFGIVNIALILGVMLL